MRSVYGCVSFMSGIGFGTRGFHRARAMLVGHEARFGVPLGIDLDARACQRFERITGGHALVADFHTLQPADVRNFCRPYLGERAPLLVMSSPPCKPFSQLLPRKKAEEPHYLEMARLYLKALNLAVETWEDGPAVVAFENVRGIMKRGAELLEQARQILRSRYYAIDERVFDCAEVGGLGAHRPRHILIGRRMDLVRQVISLPPVQPVKTCGEVIRALPLPNDPKAGPLHRLSNLSLITWLRLAFVRAGADHRSIPQAVELWSKGLLRAPVAPGQDPHEVIRRYHVNHPGEAAHTVCASNGSNGNGYVADDRPFAQMPLDHPAWNGSYGVMDPAATAETVRGRADVRTGPAAIADSRCAQLALTGTGRSDNWSDKPGLLGVNDWDSVAPTVTAKVSVSSSNAPAAVADPRPVNRLLLGCAAHNGAYGVQRPDETANTVTGTGDLHNGTHGYAAPLPALPVPPEYLFLSIDEALDMLARGERLPKGRIPVIPSPWDGWWHRPMTEAELALLQSHPATFDDGSPFELGDASREEARMWIGNAIPCDSAQAWGEQILLAKLRHDLGLYSLAAHGTWVAPEAA